MDKKYIVITGASGGIGQRTAEELHSRGYGVIATARNEDKLRELYGGRERFGVLPWDLSDIDMVPDYCRQVHDTYGPISGLVHCAGIGIGHSVNMIRKITVEKIFSVNTFAAMMLVSCFSKRNMHEDDASFVLISSIAAHAGTQGQSVYSASKGALESFICGSASELAEKRIRLNAVAPGLVMTDMVKNHYDKLEADTINHFKEGYPLGMSEPEDVAKCIAYLLGEDSRRVTGQTIIVDGGFMVRKP